MTLDLPNGSTLQTINQEVLTVVANGPQLFCSAYCDPPLRLNILSCTRNNDNGVTTMIAAGSCSLWIDLQTDPY